MTKNPWVNALAAGLYIVILVLGFSYGDRVLGPVNSVVAPVAMLSLLTLSVAVMAFLFFFQPFQLYFDGEKKRAIKLFLQTIGVFAGLAVVAIVVMLLTNTGESPKAPRLIGGQKDEHGCLIPAGYSWCEAKQKCLRTWEEQC